MTGPTIAPEVARGVITTALVACHDRSVAERISEKLSTETLFLVAADDPNGAELWGAYKNCVALACGLVDGLKGTIGGDNLKAALVLRGFSEGISLLGAMGASSSTAFGPAGLGDLYVTATSPRSRNRTLGEKLDLARALIRRWKRCIWWQKELGPLGCSSPEPQNLGLGHHSLRHWESY